MTLLCVLYVVLVTACLAAAGASIDAAMPARLPRRWVWCALIAMSLVVPPLLKLRHAVALDEVTWGSTRAYDGTLNRSWLISSALLAAWGLASAWRVWQLVSVARRGGRLAPAPTTVDDVPVLVSEALGPATVGVWSTRIVIPRWVLDLPERERRYVLRHEQEHGRARDALVLLVASLTLVLTPWNLALYWMQRRLRLAVEMDCDARVVRALGDARRYGALLVSIAEATVDRPPLQPAFLGGAGSLERRVRRLVAPARHAVITRVAAPALAALLLAIVLLMPHPVLGSSTAPHARAPRVAAPPVARAAPPAR